jgi:predicted nucleotidyltransferase
MRIDKGEHIAGIPASKARELMRHARGRKTVQVEDVPMLLDLPAAEAAKVVARMASLGYLEVDRHGEIVPTVRGNALAQATALPPLRRQTATRMLSEFMNRVVEVRESPRFLYKIHQVILFGSHLQGSERPNDIDLALTLCPKVYEPAERERLEEEHTAAAAAAGRKFRTEVAALHWPRVEVVEFLRARNPYLSLHQYGRESDFFARTEHKVIYVDHEMEERIARMGQFAALGFGSMASVYKLFPELNPMRYAA